MIDDRNLQILPPDNWKEFEDLCHRLFKTIWNDSSAQKNGRSGQPQHGVDIYGIPSKRQNKYHGVQCKEKSTNYSAKATFSEIKKEISKAEHFEPKLEHWNFVTTAPTDQALQKEVRLISEERKESGLFTISVFGWDDIKSLLCENKSVLREFYPGLGVDYDELIESIRALPKSDEVNKLIFLIKESMPFGQHQRGKWLPVQYGMGRGLGPALMGRSLGPSDAISCPEFHEVKIIINELEKAYFARIVGEPGAGKSLCAFQVAKDFSKNGWKIYRLDDPRNVIPEITASNTEKLLLIVDDGHLSLPSDLKILEDSANPSLMVLSTHHSNEKDSAFRSSIIIDSERAVRTIAKSLLDNYSNTLAEVCKVDDRIGEKHMDTELEYRIEQAEDAAKYPWQFCFILGGGWRRAGVAADSSRAEGADIILAAIAIYQLASRDAYPDEIKFKRYLIASDVDLTKYEIILQWLVHQRLVVSLQDLRCPHLQFASVILFKILEGQDKNGRILVGKLIEKTMEDDEQPLAGKRYLLHEISFGGEFHQWSYLVPEKVLWPLVEECWKADDPTDILHACYFLTEAQSFIKGWPKSVFNQSAVAIVGGWISGSEYPSGYGLSRLVNDIRNKDTEVAKSILLTSDPKKIAHSINQVTPKTAGHLGELISKAGIARNTDWIQTLKTELDHDSILGAVKKWTVDDSPGLFSIYCLYVSYIDEELGLSIIEVYIHVARQLFKLNPKKTFRELDDILSHVLRVVDPLGVYTGTNSPKKRHKKIARQMISELNVVSLASNLSDSRLREFQTVTFLLAFLHDIHPSKFNKVVSILDWEAISRTIGIHWKNLPHEAEILFGVTYGSKENQEKIKAVIDINLDFIEYFPPRLALINSKAAIAHVESGKVLRLGQHNHVEWEFSTGVVAIFAEERPDLINDLLKPVEEIASKNLSQAHESWYKGAAKFIEVLKHAKPESLTRILDRINIESAEKGWIASIIKGNDYRKTVSFLIEFSLDRKDGIGELARKLRNRFPKSSVPKPTIAKQDSA